MVINSYAPRWGCGDRLPVRCSGYVDLRAPKIEHSGLESLCMTENHIWERITLNLNREGVWGSKGVKSGQIGMSRSQSNVPPATNKSNV